MSVTVSFTAELFLWDGGEGSWHFVRLPVEVSGDIEDAVVGPRRGFGSLKVRATIGETTWSTSIFPEKGEAGPTFVLPVKKAVRDTEGLLADDVVEVELEILDRDDEEETG